MCIFILGALSGCIKDEMPNIEVDITDVVSDNGEILTVAYNSPVIDVFTVPGTDFSKLPLRFVVSEGATITPDPASVSDYSQPRKYLVTSEDGNWSMTYTVNVRQCNLPVSFGFENWRQPERMRYRIAYETSDGLGNDGDLHIWACGNEAYNFLTTKDDDYTVFPTLPTTECVSGQYAAKLVTRLTGQIDKPIAAGNLFIGNFDASKRDPKESTQFGFPFMRVPVAFKGYFKYRSGGATLASGQPDRCKIHAIFYKTDETTRHIDGNTVKTSVNIVARAELPAEMSADTEGDGFVAFNVPFTYVEQVDPQRLAAGGYSLAVIFSSSLNGDVYDGAPGSTLIVDDVEIEYETNE